MRQSAILLVVGLLCGFALSAFWRDAPVPAVVERPDVQAGDARLAAIDRRIAASEAMSAALEREVAELRALLLDQPAPAAIAAVGTSRGGLEPAQDEPAAPEMPAGPRARTRGGPDRLDRLVAAGFSLDRAEALERRLEELQLDAMQARYEAARQGDSIEAPVDRFFNANGVLRSELGDADYERYRDALALPTTVNVASVLSSSAAEQAGIQAGDQIVAYGGQRVFDVRELNQALLEGEPGETVLVDVVRDGQPIQVAIERGPLGIASGFGGRGNRLPR